MKRNISWLLGGVGIGMLLVVGTFHAAVLLYTPEVRFPYGAPREALPELLPCPPHVAAWRGGVCTDPRADAQADFAEVALDAPRGGKLHGWWIPHPSHASAPAVLYALGAGQDRREGLRYVRAVLDAGWSLQLLDLSNHGRSTNDGTGVHFGAREWRDLLAASRWLRAEKGAPRVVCLGVSMGGASCIYAAAMDDAHVVDGVVTEGTYASFAEVVLGQAERRHIPRALALHVLDGMHDTVGPHTFSTSPAGMVAAVSPRPYLQIVDGADALVDAWQSDLLFEMARAPKTRVEIPGARHAQATNTEAATVAAALRDHLGSIWPSRAPVMDGAPAPN